MVTMYDCIVSQVVQFWRGMQTVSEDPSHTAPLLLTVVARTGLTGPSMVMVCFGVCLVSGSARSSKEKNPIRPSLQYFGV